MAGVKQDYDIETDSVMFQKGQHFDVRAVGNAQSPWWNRTLCEVNNAWVRLASWKVTKAFQFDCKAWI
jgi:hypothetical protein